MRVLLIYYTGTYNTRYLTHQVKERFCSLGWDVDAVEITVDTPPVCTDGYALILIRFMASIRLVLLTVM